MVSDSKTKSCSPRKSPDELDETFDAYSTFPLTHEISFEKIDKDLNRKKQNLLLNLQSQDSAVNRDQTNEQSPGKYLEDTVTQVKSNCMKPMQRSREDKFSEKKESLLYHNIRKLHFDTVKDSLKNK